MKREKPRNKICICNANSRVGRALGGGEKWKGQETAGYEIEPSLSLNPISNSSTSPSRGLLLPPAILLKKNPDSFLLITSGTTVDRQTERTPGILIKRNPNPQPVVELNPVSDSRFNWGGCCEKRGKEWTTFYLTFKPFSVFFPSFQYCWNYIN